MAQAEAWGRPLRARPQLLAVFVLLLRLFFKVQAQLVQLRLSASHLQADDEAQAQRNGAAEQDEGGEAEQRVQRWSTLRN